MEVEISKLETCGKVANYYIKEPTPEGDIRIYLCKEHRPKVEDCYLYMWGGIQYCQESI